MRTSFIGLVTQFGLESLTPECALSCRWLQQAARTHKATCIWAVLEQDIASEIADLLTIDERWTALGQLSDYADCWGRLEEVSASGGEWMT